MKKQRLLKLAAFLDKLPPKQFDLGTYVKSTENGCGTVCCAIGWCPKVFPAHWVWNARSIAGLSLKSCDSGDALYFGGMDAAAKFFGIELRDAEHLFAYDPCAGPYSRFASWTNVPPKRVAEEIRKFVGARSKA